MSRYPSEGVARFDQQFLETASERNERFRQSKSAVSAAATARDREKVAAFMIRLGFATGHGDTIDDLLIELDGQIIGRMDRVEAAEREAIAHDFERMGGMLWTAEVARIIRSRRA